ncbi:MAG: STAS domain-containing protein [Acidimicrobiales bacterium]|nr:STAS domain-containing protein [Acidimicrobiales bacterium]
MLVLDVEERPLGRVLIVSGDLDVATAPQVRSEVVRLLGDGISDLVIDLTRVDFIDSFGLGVLVGALKRVRGAGGHLGLVITEPRVRKVFEVTGLDRVFELTETVDAALER